MGALILDNTSNQTRKKIFDRQGSLHSKSFDDNSYIVAIEADLEEKKNEAVLARFVKLHYSDQALLLQSIKHNLLPVLLEIVRSEISPDVFPELNYDTKVYLVHSIGHKYVGKKLNELDNESIVCFLSSLSRFDQVELLRYIDLEKRKIVRIARSYPGKSIGSIMHSNYYIVSDSNTVKESLSAIKNQSHDNKKLDRIYEVFVTDNDDNLTGTVAIESLLQFGDDVKIKEIMNTDFIAIRTTDKKKEVAKIFNKYDLNIVPVLDAEGQLAGSVTIDSIKYIAVEEQDDGMLKMSGAFTDLGEGIFQTTKMRFIWLFINLITTALASWIISFFEATIHEITALAVLMPITVSMGSNAGTQTVAVVIRALATNQLNKGTFSSYLNKETIMAIINSLLFAMLCTAAAYFIYYNLALALVFGIAIAITLITSVFAGLFAPIIMKYFKTDPAITSVVLLTAIIDVVAFLSFLGLAKKFLT